MESKEIIEGKISDTQAYEILRMPGCPIQLPTARSMTQAKIDLDHLKPKIIKWYNSTTSKTEGEYDKEN